MANVQWGRRAFIQIPRDFEVISNVFSQNCGENFDWQLVDWELAEHFWLELKQLCV
jgi:hypothetical protein